MPTKAKIPIPQNMTVVGSKCVQINLPDDAEWQGMFWGALYQLTVWDAYQRDSAHQGADVATVWKSIIDEARADMCPATVLLNQTSPCELSASYDGGATWTPVYQGMLCIQEALNEGIVSPGNPTNWTHTYDFTASDGGWTANPVPSGGVGDEAIYTAGVGWEDDYWYHPPSNTAYRECTIKKTWSSSPQITVIQVVFPVFSAGLHTDTSDGSQGDSFRLFGSGGNFFNACPPVASPRTFIVNVTTNQLIIECWVGYRSGGTSDPGGDAVIASVSISGVGTDPGA